MTSPASAATGSTAATELKNLLSSSTASSSSNPYAALQSIRDTYDPTYLFLRTTLELTSSSSSSSGHDPTSEELLFHSITGTRHVLLQTWDTKPKQFVDCVRDYMFDVALTGGGGFSKTLRMTCLATCASFWKRSWSSEEREQTGVGGGAGGGTGGVVMTPEVQALMEMMSTQRPNYQHISNHDALFSYVESILLSPLQQQQQGTTQQQHSVDGAMYATSFLITLLHEFSQSNTAISYNLSLEFHRLAHDSFERTYLDRTLHIAMTGLGGLVQILSSSGTGGGVVISKEMLALTSEIVTLTTDILSWEFGTVGGGKWDPSKAFTQSDGGATLIRPPAKWREYIIRPDFLGAIFNVYNTVRHLDNNEEASGSLSHKVRQLLISLSSVTGHVYDSERTKVAYAGFMVEGTLNILRSLSTEQDGSNETSDRIQSETIDTLSIIHRLVGNFGIRILCQLPTFHHLEGGLLTSLYAMGDVLLRANTAECRTVCGDIESMLNVEWRDEAINLILESAVLLGDDPWLILPQHGSSNKNEEEQRRIISTRNALSTNLSPLYNSYVQSRVTMGQMEEYYITKHETELDEIRESISETDLEEEMNSAASLGRLNVQASLMCLEGMLGGCLPRLRTLFETASTTTGGSNGGGSVTPEHAALLEESRLLIVCTTHLLTDDNTGETPMIPESISTSCSSHFHPETTAQQTIGIITNIINSLVSVAEYQLSKVVITPSNPILSPLLAKTLLWFLQRWAPAYILPTNIDHPNESRSGIGATWSDVNTSARQAISFCVTLCVHYNCYWPQERQVQECATLLLLSLARRGSEIRTLLLHTGSFRQLIGLHVVTAGLRHNASEEEVIAAINASGATVDGGGDKTERPTPEMVRGYRRMPYEDRAKVLTALLVGCGDVANSNGQAAGSSGGGSGSGGAEAMLSSCLNAIYTSFSTLVQALSTKQIHPQDLNAKEMSTLCVTMYTGTTHASDITNPERIVQFITPSLPHLSGLMSYYAHDLTICESLLKLFRDYAEQFIAMLNKEECMVLFKSSAELLRMYSEHHCASRTVVVIKKGHEADLEEEQNYSDVLCAIQLLIHLGTKDFIDICNTTSSTTDGGGGSVESGQVTDVIFFGLQQIIPLMTQGLLQFPTLCTQYFSLVGFMMDTYPDKVCLLPYDLFSALLDSLLFGMSQTSTFVSKSSLRGIAGLAREQLKSSSLTHHLNTHPDIIDNCTRRLLSEVIFQTIIWDRLEPTGMALLPLAAVNIPNFVNVVHTISLQLFGNNNTEKQQRLENAFSKLMKQDVLAKVASGGYEGRMNRMRFKKDFEVFVRDVHSFLVIK